MLTKDRDKWQSQTPSCSQSSVGGWEVGSEVPPDWNSLGQRFVRGTEGWGWHGFSSLDLASRESRCWSARGKGGRRVGKMLKKSRCQTAGYREHHREFCRGLNMGIKIYKEIIWQLKMQHHPDFVCLLWSAPLFYQVPWLLLPTASAPFCKAMDGRIIKRSTNNKEFVFRGNLSFQDAHLCPAGSHKARHELSWKEEQDGGGERMVELCLLF